MAPIGLLASGLLVWQASYAAFSGTTSNGANTWSAGTVSISDDDSNAVMFSPTGLKPGDSGTKCIQATYTGSLAAAVKLYATVTAGSPDLSPNIQLSVDEGTGGTSASCAGFSGSNVYTGTLAGFASNYATGVGTWAPAAAGATHSYRFTYTLDANTPNTAQGGSAGATFTWEAQNS